MKAVILVPFRRDGAERSRNWHVVRDRLASLGWSVVSDPGPPGPFCRAKALNAAAAVMPWDVALVCDADIYLEQREQAREAVARASDTGSYTVAHDSLCYLDEEATRRLDARRRTDGLPCDEEAQTWESCFAVRRDLWDKVGGFDERFVGYGFQGVAFFAAAGTLGGRERVTGRAWHLAHPFVDRETEPHFEENGRLADRYLAAVDDPEAMRRILDRQDA